MITASHNPKRDNGFKVYWSNGCQIIPPHDTKIARCIEENQVPWTWDTTVVDRALQTATGSGADPVVCDPREEVEAAYFQSIARWHQPLMKRSKPVDLSVVYTAMHGVGQDAARKLFQVLEIPVFMSVEVQAKPDPSFPTLPFPNPEEEGALAEAFKKADAHGAGFVFANDPDADRFAFAVRDAEGKWGNLGEWITMTGNQMGALMAAFLSRRLNGRYEKMALITTCVSSRMLSAMAEVEGLVFQETLTGFKWMGNAAVRLRQQGCVPIFAYEEAIGFMCGSTVCDKDGISAMGVFAELLVDLREQNRTVLDFMDELYLTYGYFASLNHYVVCSDPVRIQAAFDRLRYPEADETTPSYPQLLGEFQVVSVRDLRIGYDTADHPSGLPVCPSSENLRFELKIPSSALDKDFASIVDVGHAVLTIRTSGTEPKVKYYTDMPMKIRATYQGRRLEYLRSRVKPRGREILGLVEKALKDQWLTF